MDAIIRKLENNLLTLGTGIIVFSLWSFIRAGMSIFVFDELKLTEEIPDNLHFIVYVIIIVFATLMFLFEFYIGYSARKESKSSKKHITYLICAGIMLFLYLLISVAEFITLFTDNERGLMSIIASIIIEITSSVCIAEMMANGIKLRKLRKELQKNEKEAMA